MRVVRLGHPRRRESLGVQQRDARAIHLRGHIGESQPQTPRRGLVRVRHLEAEVPGAEGFVQRVEHERLAGVVPADDGHDGDLFLERLEPAHAGRHHLQGVVVCAGARDLEDITHGNRFLRRERRGGARRSRERGGRQEREEEPRQPFFRHTGAVRTGQTVRRAQPVVVGCSRVPRWFGRFARAPPKVASVASTRCGPRATTCVEHSSKIVRASSRAVARGVVGEPLTISPLGESG